MLLLLGLQSEGLRHELALAHAADLDGEASKSCGRLKKGWRSTDFVNHMRNDYEVLMDLVKRSTEDVSFMLHLVAQQYLQARLIEVEVAHEKANPNPNPNSNPNPNLTQTLT